MRGAKPAKPTDIVDLKNSYEKPVHCSFCGRSAHEIRKIYKHFITEDSFRISRLLYQKEKSSLLAVFRRTADLKIACCECLVQVCSKCATPLDFVPPDFRRFGFWCKKCRKFVRGRDIVLMGFDKRKGKVTWRQVKTWCKIIALRRQEAILNSDIE